MYNIYSITQNVIKSREHSFDTSECVIVSNVKTQLLITLIKRRPRKRLARVFAWLDTARINVICRININVPKIARVYQLTYNVSHRIIPTFHIAENWPKSANPQMQRDQNVRKETRNLRKEKDNDVRRIIHIVYTYFLRERHETERKRQKSWQTVYYSGSSILAAEQEKRYTRDTSKSIMGTRASLGVIAGKVGFANESNARGRSEIGNYGDVINPTPGFTVSELPARVCKGTEGWKDLICICLAVCDIY